MSKFSIGSDAEFFVKNSKSGKIVSAIDVVHGSKDAKIDLGNGHAAFYDNVLAECNIKPSNTKKEALTNFQDCFSRYANLIKPYELVPQSSYTFPLSELNHPEARKFGCEPDFDAYKVCVNDPPFCNPKSGFRTGGGHIHLGGKGWPLEDSMGKIEVIKAMDLFIGIPSIFIDHDPTSAARRKLYGKAGSHRPQPYGVEYRSISNFWLISPDYVSIIYDLCDFVLDVCVNHQHEDIFEMYNADNLCECINTGDKSGGKPALNICEKLIPNKIWKEIVKLMKPSKINFYEAWNIKV